MFLESPSAIREPLERLSWQLDKFKTFKEEFSLKKLEKVLGKPYCKQFQDKFSFFKELFCLSEKNKF